MEPQVEARRRCNRGRPLKGLLIKDGRARAWMLSSCHREGQSIHSCLFRDSRPPGIPSKALNRGDILSQESGGGVEKERECRRAELQDCTIPVSELHSCAYGMWRYSRGKNPVLCLFFTKGPLHPGSLETSKLWLGVERSALEALCPWSDSWERGSMLTIGSRFWCHICMLKPTLWTDAVCKIAVSHLYQNVPKGDL